MNNLNSVILEGVIISCNYSENSDFSVATLNVLFNRSFVDRNNQLITETSTMKVLCYEKLAKSCHKNATPDRGIRIVGRLRQEKFKEQDGRVTSEIVLIAEHIEFKPKTQKSEKKEN